MINSLFYQSVFKWIFIISLGLMLVISYYKDNLPDPKAYNFYDLKPPLQTETFREPFSVIVNKQHYLITPKFNYELTGMVVTYNDSDSITDISHHDLWKDFINLRDLCVIWNPNVSSGVYKDIKFSSDSWTCWVEWIGNKTTEKFRPDALSNNHVLTDNNRIKKILLSVEKGDLIYFKGVLAEYRNEEANFTRGTSTVRTDTGNGACETVYLDDFKIIKKANPILRNFYILTKWITILSFIIFLILFIINPHRVKDK